MVKELLDGIVARIVIILVLIGGTALYFWVSGLDWRSKEEKESTRLVAKLADELDQQTKKGLYDRADGTIETDAWGNTLKVVYEEEGIGERLLVTSAGEDGRFATEDDIVESRWLLNASGVGKASSTFVGEVAKEATKGALDGIKESAKQSIKKRLPFKKDKGGENSDTNASQDPDEVPADEA